jgi:uncharacterized membrane protein
MKSRAAIAGHPLHPIFVTIPVGLWSFAPICDLIYHMRWGDATWKATAFYCIGGGILGAIPAIITGYIDYGIVQGAKAAAVAKFHLILNAIVTTVFLVSLGLRLQEFKTSFSLVPVFLSFGGALLLGISGYLGGELVSRFGVSVHRDIQVKSGN